MKFECDVKGCNFKTAKRLEALAHVRIHKDFGFFELYEAYKRIVVDEEAGK